MSKREGVLAMRATFLLAGSLWGLASLPGCAQSRCAGEECTERGTEPRAAHASRSQHYRIELRAGAVEGRELRSERYRLRVMAGAVQLEARP
jgi:hypothetical protein